VRAKRIIIRSVKAMAFIAAVGVVLLILVGLPGMFAPARVGPGRFEGAMTVDYSPISTEQAKSLIEGGRVSRMEIRPSQPVNEFSYLLHYEGIEEDALPVALETTYHWNVDGVDVHVFTESMPTGVPILSADGASVGLTSAEFEDMLVLVAQYNGSASSPVEVLDLRR
jgi:hypothetical protein